MASVVRVEETGKVLTKKTTPEYDQLYMASCTPLRLLFHISCGFIQIYRDLLHDVVTERCRDIFLATKKLFIASCLGSVIGKLFVRKQANDD